MGVIEDLNDFVVPLTNKDGYTNKRGHVKAKEIAKNYDLEALRRIVAFFDSVSIYADLEVVGKESKKVQRTKKRPKETQHSLFGDLD